VTGTTGRRIARMTGQLEQPESFNDRKARMTGKTELLYRKSRNDQIDPCVSILTE
jgi:hypothetical protein